MHPFFQYIQFLYQKKMCNTGCIKHISLIQIFECNTNYKTSKLWYKVQ